MLQKFLTSLAHLHKATEQSFLKYGHIYFFVPIAYDHFHTTYGMVMAGVTGILATAAGAYTIGSYIFSNTDG